MERDEEIFKKEYMCIWNPVVNEEKEEAYKLWLYYYYQTELFDSRVCTGSNQYVDYIPRTNEEHRASNQFSSRLWNEILREKRTWEFENGKLISDDDWQSAKRELSRLRLKGLEMEYKQIYETDKEKIR